MGRRYFRTSTSKTGVIIVMYSVARIVNMHVSCKTVTLSLQSYFFFYGATALSGPGSSHSRF